MPELREITDEAAWERAVPILRQLWSHVDESFVRSWRDEDEYRLLGWYRGTATEGDDGETEGTLLAVAGVYVQTVVHHERGCWVHDLVVDEAHRGEGHGEAFLAALQDWADDRDCAHLALVCAADNEDAARFYEDAGMETFGTVYEREL